jgi:hypothetical protein
MSVIEVESWVEFEKRLQEVRQDATPVGNAGEFLFRGLADSTWELTTTLERAALGGRAISEYYQIITRLKPQIESFTGNKWKIRAWPKVKQLLQDYESWANSRFPTPEEYSYMVYLRHHGFPSPLLDWTRSPNIAAFFAFRSSEKPGEGKVSIYAYLEMKPRGYKITTSYKPWIRRGGAFVSTHRRHFLQQSDYTMCAHFRNDGGQWYFAKHDSVFQGSERHQDFLWKFTIPWTERLNVLRLLDEHNLNAYSLFGSEESLMETLAVRVLELHGHGSIHFLSPRWGVNERKVG